MNRYCQYSVERWTERTDDDEDFSEKKKRISNMKTTKKIIKILTRRQNAWFLSFTYEDF
jgi:hypothetical protein